MQAGKRVWSLQCRWMSQGFLSRPVPFSQDSVDKCVDTESLERQKKKLLEYHDLLAQSLAGGGPRGVERHVLKNKKVLIRERIKLLLDPGTPFLEIGALAGFEMPYETLAAAGVVAGIGRIRGVYCMISGNDATVKAGTYYPITVIKSGRVQNIAENNRLPVIYIPDSGGAFLPLQSQIFVNGGRGFYNQAVMSSKGIAQIAVVCGSCTAGGAYNPTMSDEAIIIDRIGKIFLGGPPLVKAATGEIVTDEELGGAWMHSSVSGCTDYFAKTEAEGFEICREIVESLNMAIVSEADLKTYEQPKLGINWEDLEGKDHYEKAEVYGILGRLLDGSNFKEFKSFYGPGLITGTGYIEGNLLGIVANADEILESEALKGTHFLDMCSRRNIPIIFLQNSTPKQTQLEDSDPRVLKSRGSLAAAVATLSVPKISVTLSGCFGQDSILMCGPSFNPNLNFSWPTAKFSPYEMTISEDDASDKVDALDAAFNMVVDSVITPSTTRPILGETLRMLQQMNLNPQKQRRPYPIIRM